MRAAQSEFSSLRHTLVFCREKGFFFNVRFDIQSRLKLSIFLISAHATPRRAPATSARPPNRWSPPRMQTRARANTPDLICITWAGGECHFLHVRSWIYVQRGFARPEAINMRPFTWMGSRRLRMIFVPFHVLYLLRARSGALMHSHTRLQI